ncbi:hypothetical protein ACMGDM_14990 [Sphingomonas sp. DT-51]|uniref:hypothetical protein n=1 Tax=Sphingomonas sp. DT-51 TaxID=3396165 RepID=UPI003F1AEFC1
MQGGPADRRIEILAEGLRTAARLARTKAFPVLAAGEDADHDRALIARTLGSFADELDATAFRFEELVEGTIAVTR